MGRNKPLEPSNSSFDFTAKGFTIPTAAAYLGCKSFFVRSLIRQGLLPYAVLGKRWVVDKSDLDRFLDSRKQVMTQPKTQEVGGLEIQPQNMVKLD